MTIEKFSFILERKARKGRLASHKTRLVRCCLTPLSPRMLFPAVGEMVNLI